MTKPIRSISPRIAAALLPLALAAFRVTAQ
jgi:hypothetical protein